ncbi:MAG: cyclophane-forming radical SAM/SPASM peptide maturase YhhB [Brevundimonas sp.]|uniref:cyclophane-forming radical SAM/SPASM peptide maturase YhhB n=1 Tax=Brevundimonas sp. TaxID=1871086 RepID=UPI002732B054|nr:cyclophane-forming radical SAM/SPASM peptide maturase YhhB [Brevundimonas sp.]MDP3405814.1 cyclophane-forming radical SAM/SPASM peptide maturase YhhB [Brevundimonas sp.]
MTPARITSFLVKVASRCNLDCDYCYVYHHADQSWRSMPKLLSAADQETFAGRLADYARETALSRVAVIFHGGEPLLAGAPALCEFAGLIRARVGPDVEVDVGLQTNGILLDEAALDLFEAANIGVSLSLDGPRAVNDLHRTSRRGRSSFEKVETALERLKRRPGIFAGVIAVVDASTDPEDLLAYFDKHSPPRLDFLLPDAHHLRPPPGRDVDADLYARWQIRAFDAWFDRYPSLTVRSFEALLDALMGLPSSTDAFGFGDVSLISIETDGSYHDLDVLKVVGNGTQLGGTVHDTPIAAIAASDALGRHRALLSKDGLCEQCQACPIVDICGGGAVPHRWGADDFAHPTIYCREMTALVEHVRLRIQESLQAASPALFLDIDVDKFELAETAADELGRLRADANLAHLASFTDALTYLEGLGGPEAPVAARLLAWPSADLAFASWQPGAVAWSHVVLAARDGRVVRDVNGEALRIDPGYLRSMEGRSLSDRRLPVIAADDAWLRAPFGAAVEFEPKSVIVDAKPLAAKALDILAHWRPEIAREIEMTSPAVQFIRDPTAHPDKIVSFSDDAVPGALFVSVRQGDGLIDAYDLADSLLHEHRHQKLYLFERRFPTTHPGDLVVSPWREDLRPVSGLFHAIFVFVELRRFWEHVRDAGPERMAARARNQLADTNANLAKAFATLEGCALTEAGDALAAVLRARGAVEMAA